MTAHIWACPPSEGDDYIFHCHPVEQKIPKPKRLVEWYRKMLDRGKSDNVVYDYRVSHAYVCVGGELVAIKDTTPVLKAGHPGSCSHVCCVMLCVYTYVHVCDGGGGNSLMSFLITLSGWYAIVQ